MIEATNLIQRKLELKGKLRGSRNYLTATEGQEEAVKKELAGTKG